MRILKSSQHVYTYIPNYLNNRAAAPQEQFTVECKALTSRDKEDLGLSMMSLNAMHKPAKAQELINAKTYQVIKSKVLKINNLVIEGFGQINTLDELYEHAPSEIFSELCTAIPNASALESGSTERFEGAATPKEITGCNGLFDYVPESFDNRIDGQIVLQCSPFTSADGERLGLIATEFTEDNSIDKSRAFFDEAVVKLIKTKLKSIKGLAVEGYGEITTADEFFEQAPCELVDELKRAVQSTITLTNNDKKKLFPLSGSDLNVVTETSKLAKTATKKGLIVDIAAKRTKRN